MSVRLYMDVHVHGGITAALKIRGVDVITAQDDGTDRYEDSMLLDRATETGRILFSNDTDLLRITSERQKQAIPFAGVLFAPQHTPIGRIINDLEVCARACEPEDFRDSVTFLPL